MKKILWLGIIFTLLFASHSGATNILTITPPTNNTLNITFNGPVGSTSKFNVIVRTTDFPAGAYTPSVTGVTPPTAVSNPQAQTLDIQGNAAWALIENSNTTYYVRIIEMPKNSTPSSYIYATSTVTATTPAPTLYYNHLTTTKNGSTIIVTGSINTAKQPNYQTYKVFLSYSSSATPATNPTTLTNPIAINIRSKVAPISGAPDGITDGYEGESETPGSYYWVLPTPGITLTAGGTYYMQQTIVDSAGNSVTDRVETFNADTGTIIPTSTAFNPSGAASNAILNTNSYTLISKGFPGLSVLPDPILCAQERADATKNHTAPPQFCDINDVLNYFLKLLIGLCGVVLVFRLMIEGYIIMTTDVPFLRAGAKSTFMTALGGLLLALTSYIILNTINPKLVQENVGVVPLAIGVTDPDTDITPLIQNTGAPTSGSAGACTAGITTVTVQKSRFVACQTYNNIPIANNLKNMLTAAYAAGITLQGGGFRTASQQTQLRIAHCAGDTTTPNANCTPPTAPVGHSNHESGLAFDFTCNGPNNTIQTHDNTCFLWLQANAANYGFKNFAKEPWHWSWDGR